VDRWRDKVDTTTKGQGVNMKIIVEDGQIEVICRDKEQALNYIEHLRTRGFKNFILIEEKKDEDQSRGQVREDIQEPIERNESNPFVGL
jgi:hypothetical protein